MAFTKSTTDLVVHQKLSDYPNQDDGLTASELKAKFDYPATTLQTEVNRVVNELNATTGASNLGASAIAVSDSSAGNVQAKLKYLYDNITEMARAGVPDGTITRAKMNDTYANTLAIKDGTMQEYLNAEFVGGSTIGNITLDSKYNETLYSSGKVVIDSDLGSQIGNGQKISIKMPTGYDSSISNDLYIRESRVGTLPSGLIEGQFVELLVNNGLSLNNYVVGKKEQNGYDLTVDLGFKPSFVVAMVKISASNIYKYFYTRELVSRLDMTSAASADDYAITDNGFKLRFTYTSGGSVYYIAFR